jgi:hypothetical protein
MPEREIARKGGTTLFLQAFRLIPPSVPPSPAKNRHAAAAAREIPDNPCNRNAKAYSMAMQPTSLHSTRPDPLLRRAALGFARRGGWIGARLRMIHFHNSLVMPERWYQEQIDPGIRFAVRLLHYAGIDTCQSCQGGKGHAYDHPTIDMVALADDAAGFGALAALQEYGLPVDTVALVWNIRQGMPYEKLWRITFRDDSMVSRANEKPIFMKGVRAV